MGIKVRDGMKYKIGVFSKITGIPVKTLRYYDEIDLFKPSEIDLFSGYRYYKEEQIESLKQKVGEKFGIEDTSNIITSFTVGKLRLKDLAKPYVLPTIISTLIILAVIIVIKIANIKIIIPNIILCFSCFFFLFSLLDCILKIPFIC